MVSHVMGRKLHNKELHDMYFLSHVCQVIESKRMKWVRHVACMGKN